MIACKPLSLLCPLLLVGCTLGPDYNAAPDSQLQGKAFARQVAGTRAQTPQVADWWRTLNDPALDQLIDSALGNSPDLQAAAARLRQARAGLAEKRSNLMPKSSATAAALYTGSGDSQTDATHLYLSGFDASWELDIFGASRRAVEAAHAEADAVQADMADAHVQLAAEVGQAYIGLRDQQQRLRIARQSEQLERQLLDFTEQRLAQGTASELDRERIATQVETTRAASIALELEVIESLDELALLSGLEPGALDTRLGRETPLPTLPATVNIGDPAQLLQQRPDIRAAERRLASSTAQIGEHKAAAFPKVSLFGSLSFSASAPGHLLRKDNFSALGVPYLQWNWLDFGRVQAQVKQAEAGRDEALAKYRSSVLNALRDADVALARYGNERQRRATLGRVETSAVRASALTEQRYRAGTSSVLDWLDAERTRYRAEQDRVHSDGQLIKDYIALQKSLGLGWRSPT
ncbi:efflux transporter outer membrane subunit [Pseudomonas fragi]|uniref:efflux transporter outer membrane subunit n=1 Tax=Pseudomonas fragi TaxID=296 RepID=UPI00193B105A|nr:TolC family protein [Pseudomonas fragi]MBM1202261.1 TolC family protein [Pseudomonas fragi]